MNAVNVGDRVSLEAKVFFDEGRREGVVIALPEPDKAMVEFPWPGGRPDDVMRMPVEIEYLALVRPAAVLRPVVIRTGLLRVEWFVQDVTTGEVFATGHARTKGSAWADACLAACNSNGLARMRGDRR